MSTLHSLSSSSTESNDDHSRFFTNSDDDADTASQRSISLSSGPSSPKLTDGRVVPSPPNLMTPINTSSVYQSVSSEPKEAPTDLESHERDHENISVGGTGTSGPSSAVASLKFDGDSTRLSSMSSRTSFDEHNEDTYIHKHNVVASTTVEATYSPPPPTPSGYGYATDNRGTDQESILSTTSSSGGRKTRPESILLAQDGPLVLGIALVDFNHVVGPRVEFFEGSVFEDEELIKILPFLALPDGAHLSSEDYSYFHLVPSGPKPSTIFGISCNRQIAAAELLSKSEDVTRSMVQKAVVVLVAKPVFGAVRDKLGVVTNAYFNQRDFRETSLLTDFVSTLETSLRSQLTESGLYMGTSIRELVYKFRHRTLIVLKALILQKKIMFYGHPVDRLCTYQYSLVSLIPLLMQALEDCGSPPLAARAPTLSRPTSLRTSDRKSLLAFVGLPLDIFGKDAFFQPYLPLQQLDIARDTNSWLCGCTNSIVYTQSNYDLLVNIETNTFEFQDSKFEKLVALTPADRKWIDDLVKDVNDSWNESDPTRPSGMQFKGSDDYLRVKFEEYVSAALATIKYSIFLAKSDRKSGLITEGFGTESQQDFNLQWIAAFKTTQAFETWDRITDSMLFDIVEPRHPCVDKPTAVGDIGLRLSEGVRDLKIEQQLAPTREALSSVFSTGSASFFKAVDGIKGRWPASRTASTTSLQSTTLTSTSSPATPIAETAKTSSGSTADSASINSTASTRMSTSTASVKEAAAHSSTVAAQMTNDARATIGAWGSSMGSFFSSRAGRFSLARKSTSSIVISASTDPATPERPTMFLGRSPKTDSELQDSSLSIVSGEQVRDAATSALPP